MTDHCGLLLDAEEPGTDRRVVLEDDGQVVYAYLLRAHEFLSHVWLFNTVATPEEPEWNDGEPRAYRNPATYCADGSVHALQETRPELKQETRPELKDEGDPGDPTGVERRKEERHALARTASTASV